ncbi:MAG: hypothetical protein GMKNLPBB_03365 [Myxococcota bacterium]|nr:hypothetical protein [Myxococcota bacterium]
MRLGLFSDIHGNVEALTRVLEDMKSQGVDQMICLGDIVGYGANPGECIQIIRDLGCVCLMGNHDAAVAGKMDYSFYYEAARHSLDWCARNISLDHMQWLSQRPYTHRVGEDVLCCHGSPVQPAEFEYIFSPEQARAIEPHLNELAPVVFIGHSHLTKVFALSTLGVNEVLPSTFGIRRGYTYVITVGSVGQPRDYDNRSCYGIFDTEKKIFEYRRVEYDIKAQASKILAAGLHPNFAKRLFLGV